MTSSRTPLRLFLLLILANILFGTTFAANKYLLSGHIGVFSLAFVRQTMAGLIVLCVVLWRRIPFPRGRDFFMSCLLGLLVHALALPIEYFGTRLSTASNVSLLAATEAAQCVVLASLLPLAIPPTVAMMLSEVLDLSSAGAVAVTVLGELAVLPMLAYVFLGLAFAGPAAVLEDCTVAQAFGHSWDLAHGNRWQLLVFVLFSIVLVIAGLLLCCVGIVPATILINVMWCEAYIVATARPGAGGSAGSATERGPDPRRGEPSDQGLVDSSEPADLDPSAPATDEPFDPGRWREEADIPPIED